MQRNSDRSKIRVQSIILGFGIFLLVVKFVAYFITHSNALLSDALESIVNIVAGAVGLYSLVIAAKPRDADHPYGHGKVEFVSASLEGGLILMAGIGIIVKAISSLIHPHELEQLDLGLILVGLTAVANYVLGTTAERHGKTTSSLALIATGKHLKTDTWSTLAVIAAMLLVKVSGRLWLDSVIAIIMGVYIILNGMFILRRSLAGIMDEADFATLQKIINTLNEIRRPNWVDIHNLRLIKYGAHMHIDCHTTLPWYFTLEEAHEEVKAIEDGFHANMPNYLEAFIHADPCLPPVTCPFCIKHDCIYREAEFRQKIEWKLENVLTNSKHALKETMDVRP